MSTNKINEMNESNSVTCSVFVASDSFTFWHYISKERGRGASCDIMGMLPKWPLGNNHVLPGCCGFLPKEG